MNLSLSGNRIVASPRRGCVRKLYHSEENRRVEALALGLVAEIHPAVPRVHGYGDHPAPWLDFDRLEGSPPDLGDDEVASDVGTRLGELVGRMHRATMGRCASLPQRSLATLLAELPGLRKFVAPGTLEAFLRAEAACIAPPDSLRCLLHRDLRAANLLRDSSTSELHLVDFELACGGAAEGDLARLLVFEHPTAPFRDSFIAAYGLSAVALERMLRVHAPVFAIEMLGWFVRRPTAEPADGILTERLVATLEAV